MRKTAVVLLTLCLLCSSALAGSDTVSVVEWSWFEEAVTGQVEGSFHSFEGLPFKVWIPTAFEEQEETPFELGDSTIFLATCMQVGDVKWADLDFGTADATVYPYDTLLQALKETENISDITPMIINGYTALRYKYTPDPWIKSGAVYWIDDSTVLDIEIGYYPENYDESYDVLFNYVSFSVQPDR